MTPIETFRILTAREPFPWQKRLLQKWGNADFSDDLLRLETGTGKTSTIAIWLAALASNPTTIPRRLIYVVNRRTVVDQTTSEVEAIRERLRTSELNSILRNLGAISLEKDEPALAVSTLRGQLADNQIWSADPARPAVIIGTVDMIGSRLLFSGYGIGWRSRPLHAGFIGQDSIIIHDECHLEPAFQSLLESIRTHQASSFRPATIVALSATPRNGQATAFNLDHDDHKDPILGKRLKAPKKLTLHSVADAKILPELIAKKAHSYVGNGRPILVFTNTVEDALKVEQTLKKTLKKAREIVRTLTGTMRGLERDALVENPVFSRFTAAGESAESEAAILVATSAGEVGINLSAAHMICDLVSFERMTQRLGRLNRFGEFDSATIDVFHASKVDEHLERTRLLLEEMKGDASPVNLSTLDESKRDAACSPPPEIIPATDIIFDALSLTTIRNLPSKPVSLDPFLHGIVEKERPRTTIAWREEVALIQEELLAAFSPEELLESFRLKPHETLNDRSDRVLKELRILAQNQPDKPVWLVGHTGEVEVRKLGDMLKCKSLSSPLVILPPSAGGLSEAGMLDGSAPMQEVSLDVCCRYGERLRTWDTEWPGKEWKLVQRIEFDSDEDDSKIWSWYEKAWGGDGEGQQTSQTVYLDEHHAAVEALAVTMAKSLGLPSELVTAVGFSARWHDRGKARRLWQNAAGNHESRPVAKQLGHSFSRPGFRHELASLVDIQSDPDFIQLTENQREIVQQMIGAHHGRARPIFPTAELHDPEIPSHIVGQVAKSIPLRFSELQTRFGHWGLAYLESILRAADYAASAGRTANIQFND